MYSFNDSLLYMYYIYHGKEATEGHTLLNITLVVGNLR